MCLREDEWLAMNKAVEELSVMKRVLCRENAMDHVDTLYYQ